MKLVAKKIPTKWYETRHSTGDRSSDTEHI